MTLPEWVAKYERKTGEQFNVPDGFQLAFDEAYGFFCFSLDERDGIKFFNIAHTCVNSWKWVIDCSRPLAVAFGAKYFVTATNRNEKAYQRLTGGIRIPEFDYDDYKVFKMEV